MRPPPFDDDRRADAVVQCGRFVFRLAAFLADAQGIPPNELPEIPFGRPVVLAIGPEGGFTAAERKHAIQAGWSLIRLSVNTLRIETAALAGASILFSKAKEPDE